VRPPGARVKAPGRDRRPRRPAHGTCEAVAGAGARGAPDVGGDVSPQRGEAMQTSGVSNGSAALQALQTLMASLAAGPAAGAGFAGQGLPGGADATPGAAAPTLPGNGSGGRFIGPALAFLTALQDPDSAAASAAKGMASVAVAHLTDDLGSALDRLTQALGGSADTASAASAQLTGLASTSSNAAAALAGGTASSLFQALDQLGAMLGLFGRHHHGGAPVRTASASAGPLAAPGSTASVTA
jgi:hypothetical protein